MGYIVTATNKAGRVHYVTPKGQRGKRSLGLAADAEIFTDLAAAHIAIREMPPVLEKLGLRYDVKSYFAGPHNRIATAFFPPVSL
jgi:hypothetical protein